MPDNSNAASNPATPSPAASAPSQEEHTSATARDGQSAPGEALKKEDDAKAAEGKPTANEGDPHENNNQKKNADQPQRGKESKKPRTSIAGWGVLILTVLLAAVAGMVAVTRAVTQPRTDDAEVFANYIGMAPQVEGPITQFTVSDNQFVRAGQLLFVVDERPYQYALERALSEQAALEGQIEDRRRTISSQISNVQVQNANIASSQSNREAVAADVSEARANLRDAQAALLRAEADQHYAADNLHRLEPLLVQQFVTIDQVDQARTLLETRTRAVQQAQAQVELAQARIESQKSHYDQSSAEVEQRRAQRNQASNGVEVLSPLTSQREERAAAVRQAQYNLNNCRVYAPFDGYITNLTTSLGEYVHVGAQVFTVIDARQWWVVANFRETQLKHIATGSEADVFLMQRDAAPMSGTVESIGFGVTPDPSVTGVASPGLPAVQRTLNWVHLAARYPVRIRINHPPPDLLRIGQSAVAVVHPLVSGQRGSTVPAEAH